jgi:amino acid transporter
MLSSVSQTFVIVWLLANILFGFLITTFWKRLDNQERPLFDPIPIPALLVVGYCFYCLISCGFIAKWFGVDEDKHGVFIFVYMVFLLFIHTWYYDYLQEKK